MGDPVASGPMRTDNLVNLVGTESESIVANSRSPSRVFRSDPAETSIPHKRHRIC